MTTKYRQGLDNFPLRIVGLVTWMLTNINCDKYTGSQSPITIEFLKESWVYVL